MEQNQVHGKYCSSFDLILADDKISLTCFWPAQPPQIFDAPSMGSKPVEERWAEIEKRFGSTDGIDIDSLQGPQIKLVKHIKCEGRDHLAELMKLVELKGGEG